MTELVEIKAQFSTREKWRNAQECRPLGTCSAEGIMVEGDGELVPALAKKLIAAGYDPDQMLSVYRGEMECLLPHPLAKWASGKVGKGEQPKQLRKARK